jgi:hypothetical protein
VKLQGDAIDVELVGVELRLFGGRRGTERLTESSGELLAEPVAVGAGVRTAAITAPPGR